MCPINHWNFIDTMKFEAFIPFNGNNQIKLQSNNPTSQASLKKNMVGSCNRKIRSVSASIESWL